MQAALFVELVINYSPKWSIGSTLFISLSSKCNASSYAGAESIKKQTVNLLIKCLHVIINFEFELTKVRANRIGNCWKELPRVWRWSLSLGWVPPCRLPRNNSINCGKFDFWDNDLIHRHTIHFTVTMIIVTVGVIFLWVWTPSSHDCQNMITITM